MMILNISVPIRDYTLNAQESDKGDCYHETRNDSAQILQIDHGRTLESRSWTIYPSTRAQGV